MPCPCMSNKKKEAAAGPPENSYKVRLINHSANPSAVIGKSSKTRYGVFKNGDRIRIRIEDYEAEPEKFVKL